MFLSSLLKNTVNSKRKCLILFNTRSNQTSHSISIDETSFSLTSFVCLFCCFTQKKGYLEKEEELADNKTQIALTNSAFVVQLNMASVKPRDRTLNLNVQKVKDIVGSQKAFKSIWHTNVENLCRLYSIPTMTSPHLLRGKKGPIEKKQTRKQTNDAVNAMVTQINERKQAVAVVNTRITNIYSKDLMVITGSKV